MRNPLSWLSRTSSTSAVSTSNSPPSPRLCSVFSLEPPTRPGGMQCLPYTHSFSWFSIYSCLSPSHWLEPWKLPLALPLNPIHQSPACPSESLCHLLRYVPAPAQTRFPTSQFVPYSPALMVPDWPCSSPAHNLASEPLLLQPQPTQFYASAPPKCTGNASSLCGPSLPSLCICCSSY